jgi:tellurite resistance protein
MVDNKCTDMELKKHTQFLKDKNSLITITKRMTAREYLKDITHITKRSSTLQASLLIKQMIAVIVMALQNHQHNGKISTKNPSTGLIS